jgi:hypothetical protein
MLIGNSKKGSKEPAKCREDEMQKLTESWQEKPG